MATWFMPPAYVPLGVMAIVAAYAIYQAFAYPPPRMLTAAVGAGVKAAGSQQPGWIK